MKKMIDKTLIRIMNIYIDFDDCLCETARHFTALAEELFGKRIPYDSMKYFDMKKSFDLMYV